MQLQKTQRLRSCQAWYNSQSRLRIEYLRERRIRERPSHKPRGRRLGEFRVVAIGRCE